MPGPFHALVERLAEIAGLGPDDGKGCRERRERFEFGVNVFTSAGQRETAISGICERCFDAMYQEED